MKSTKFFELARKMGVEVRHEGGGEGTIIFPSQHIRDEFDRIVTVIDKSKGKLAPACLGPFDDLQSN